MFVCVYLEIPNGHCSIDACGAELATIPFVSLVDRHLAEDETCRYTETVLKGGEEVIKWKSCSVRV